MDARGIDGLLLTRDVRDARGAIAFRKGTRLRADDAARLLALSWDELHAVALAPGDVHEDAAGVRLAHAIAGAHLAVGGFAGGHWPLHAACRGLLAIDAEALAAINGIDGLAVYTLLDGQVVEAGETVARAKIVPFAIGGDVIERAEGLARRPRGLVSVRPFVATTVGVVVQEAVSGTALERFRDAIAEKVSWFGSGLRGVRVVPTEAPALAASLREELDAGARLVVVAGSRAMDPLDPVYAALESIDARLARVGVPVHPGSLLWLAHAGEIPIVGMPSCGLFSKATAFDLVLPRLMAGQRVDAAWLAGLGHGGLLTRDMAHRFPPYQASRDRGETG